MSVIRTLLLAFAETYVTSFLVGLAMVKAFHIPFRLFGYSVLGTVAVVAAMSATASVLFMTLLAAGMALFVTWRYSHWHELDIEPEEIGEWSE